MKNMIKLPSRKLKKNKDKLVCVFDVIDAKAIKDMIKREEEEYEKTGKMPY